MAGVKGGLHGPHRGFGDESEEERGRSMSRPAKDIGNGL